MNTQIKKLLTALALIIPLGVCAKDPELCNNLQDLAYKVMNLRQTGAPASQLIAMAEGNRIANAIVIAAYEEPQYNTREYQIRANKEFANRVYIECFKSVNK